MGPVPWSTLWLWDETHVVKVVGSNPSAVYWMDISDINLLQKVSCLLEKDWKITKRGRHEPFVKNYEPTNVTRSWYKKKPNFVPDIAKEVATIFLTKNRCFQNNLQIIFGLLLQENSLSKYFCCEVTMRRFRKTGGFPNFKLCNALNRTQSCRSMF